MNDACGPRSSDPVETYVIGLFIFVFFGLRKKEVSGEFLLGVGMEWRVVWGGCGLGCVGCGGCWVGGCERGVGVLVGFVGVFFVLGGGRVGGLEVGCGGGSLRVVWGLGWSLEGGGGGGGREGSFFG